MMSQNGALVPPGPPADEPSPPDPYEKGLAPFVGRNVVRFFKKHTTLAVMMCIAAVSYGGLLYWSAQLHTPLAQGGYASLLWANTSELQSGILTRWTVGGNSWHPAYWGALSCDLVFGTCCVASLLVAVRRLHLPTEPLAISLRLAWVICIVSWVVAIITIASPQSAWSVWLPVALLVLAALCVWWTNWYKLRDGALAWVVVCVLLLIVLVLNAWIGTFTLLAVLLLAWGIVTKKEKYSCIAVCCGAIFAVLVAVIVVVWRWEIDGLQAQVVWWRVIAAVLVAVIIPVIIIKWHKTNEPDNHERYVMRGLCWGIAICVVLQTIVFACLFQWLSELDSEWFNRVFWIGAWAFRLRLVLVGCVTLYILIRAGGSTTLKSVRSSTREFVRMARWTGAGGTATLLLCFVALPFNQFQEVLRITFDPSTSGEAKFWLSPAMNVYLGTIVFSLSAWFLSRALVLAVLEHTDTKQRYEGRGLSPKHADYWGAFLPRAYAILPSVFLAINLWTVSTGDSVDESLRQALQTHFLSSLALAVTLAIVMLVLVIRSWGAALPRAYAILPSVFLAINLWTVSTGDSVDKSLRQASQAHFLCSLALATILAIVMLVLIIGSWALWKAHREDTFREWVRTHLPAITPYVGGVAVLLPLLFAVWGYIFGGDFNYAGGVGTVGVLLYGLAGIVACGTAATWLSVRYGYPVPSVLLLMAASLSWYGINDNHEIRDIKSTTDSCKAASSDDPFRESFREWLSNRPCSRVYNDKNPYPVVLVAAEGGGIRAACEAAFTLATLEDELPGFRSHVFAISGVSGGSVGSALFAAMCWFQDSTPTGKPEAHWWVTTSKNVLKKDLLAPAVATLTCGEFLQAFWPYPIPEFDRAAALEKALERAWPADLGKPNFLAAGVEEYRTAFGQKCGSVPALLLNTTRVDTGDRMVISTIPTPERENGRRLTALADVAPALDLPLSTAAFMSARFTYVSPSAALPIRDRGTGALVGKRRYVDGGYYENSGAATLLDVVRALRRYGAGGGAGQCVPFRLVVLRIGFPCEEEDALKLPENPPDPLDEPLAPCALCTTLVKPVPAPQWDFSAPK